MVSYIYCFRQCCVGSLEKLDFASIRLRLGGCLFAHTGELRNKCFAEFILL